MDVEKLGHAFRDEYLAGLRRLLAADKLRLEDRTATEQLLAELAVIDWAVYIQPPPQDSSRAEHVVRYLARYMTGGPISDKRLIRVDQQDNVWFWVRSKDKSGRREAFQLSATSFLQQWSLHILPKGYTKVRSFGQWAYTKRAGYQQLCDQLKPRAAESSEANEPSEPSELLAERKLMCLACQQQGVVAELRLVEFRPRPSWREIFYGPDHPAWFERVHLPASVSPPHSRGSPISRDFAQAGPGGRASPQEKP